ncbi:hypothetical protein MMA231_01854 [Asticcacaulis sp. MM231]|uniref:hypothetical protein n=1 Tax=Asticcacaulis sp. MM231 TaxID=3157666 RepID=UPI0032D5AF3C
MSTSKQVSGKNPSAHRSAPTDTAHPSQREDPSEGDNVQEGRLPKGQTGSGDTHGKGVDETGRDSKAPHVSK